MLADFFCIFEQFTRVAREYVSPTADSKVYHHPPEAPTSILQLP
jgi:hypothetical protein